MGSYVPFYGCASAQRPSAFIAEGITKNGVQGKRRTVKRLTFAVVQGQRIYDPAGGAAFSCPGLDGCPAESGWVDDVAPGVDAASGAVLVVCGGVV